MSFRTASAIVCNLWMGFTGTGAAMTRWRIGLAALAFAIALAAAAHGAGSRTYTIDSARSRATIEVGKSGPLSFAAGHTHEVAVEILTGTITVDADNPGRSTVRVVIDASKLQVTGRGESAADVPKVQETMAGAQVLDVRQYPNITFTSTSVAVKNQQGPTLEAIVTGELTIRKTMHAVSVPVSIRIAGDTLTATGGFPVKQTDYGIKPVSVGGVVSVKDVLNITFTIVGG